MNLSEIKDKIYIDANIFIYTATSHPLYSNYCSDLIFKIENNKVESFTSALTISETLHKLIIIKVSELNKLKPYESLNLIKKKPEILTKLKEPYDAIDKILSIQNLCIIPLTGETINLANKYVKKYKLMTNDAIHVATMKQNDITNLASNDSDFERVGWINLFKPKEEQ